MEHRIEVYNRRMDGEPPGGGLLRDVSDLGVDGVEWIETVMVYKLFGELSGPELERIAAELLADPVTQEYVIGAGPGLDRGHDWAVEVGFKDGVTDTVGETAVKGVRDLGILSVERARTARKRLIRGRLDADTVELISRRLFANPIIEYYAVEQS